MCYIYIYVDHELDLNLFKVMVSVGKYLILGDYFTFFAKIFNYRFHGNGYKIGPNECLFIS